MPLAWLITSQSTQDRKQGKAIFKSNVHSNQYRFYICTSNTRSTKTNSFLIYLIYAAAKCINCACPLHLYCLIERAESLSSTPGDENACIVMAITQCQALSTQSMNFPLFPCLYHMPFIQYLLFKKFTYLPTYLKDTQMAH